MAGAAVGMMVVGAFLVAGVAIWLLLTATSLDQIGTRLEIINRATSGISDQLEPAPGVVDGIARDVEAIQTALHGLVGVAASSVAAVPAIELTRGDPEPEYVFTWANEHADYAGAQARVAQKRF